MIFPLSIIALQQTQKAPRYTAIPRDFYHTHDIEPDIPHVHARMHLEIFVVTSTTNALSRGRMKSILAGTIKARARGERVSENEKSIGFSLPLSPLQSSAQ